MSRIYEALQKAENERANDSAERSRPIQADSQPDPLLPVDAAPPLAQESLPEYSEPAAIYSEAVPRFSEPAPRFSEPTPLYAEPAPRFSEPAAMRDFPPPGRIFSSPGLNFEDVPRRPWNPVLAKLPALLDRGAEVEQFRSLRSRIFELRDASPLKSVLISSGLPQEGKSFVAANLAISLARHKSSRVLLIDGDMRRYTLHQFLGCESHPGLADYLAGKVGIDQILQRGVETASPTATEHQPLPPNLTFIAAGDGGDNAADLSGSARFADLIRTVSPGFDWIIVDSSPVLPVSDAVNLARSCDGVLLVARSGITKFQVAQRAQAELKASKILGFVLNAVTQPLQTVGYYGYDAEAE